MPAVIHPLLHVVRPLLAGLAALALAGPALGNCLDEDKLDALPAMPPRLSIAGHLIRDTVEVLRGGRFG